MNARPYELCDFGDGRKLELWDNVLIDRPCPAATCPRLDKPRWAMAAAHYGRKSDVGVWTQAKDLPPNWTAKIEELDLELKLTASGQVGVFPEQAVNWNWIRRKAKSRPGLRVLNLFAYTGGSTLAAAQAGANVVHVDSATSVVNWAKRNATICCPHTPIRWIVEDVRRFVSREVKRGNKYDAVILDPPSYGHGPKGKPWKLSRDLLELLMQCKKLMSDAPAFVLLSCHTPGFGPAELNAMLCESLFGSCAAGVHTRKLSLTATDGRKLPAGYAAYWP